jgi:uncharacterized repeat protein (TIGR01451 family)
VKNWGPADATNVVVTDFLPAGVTFVATSGCAEDAAGVPSCTLGTIPAGGSASFTVTVAVDPATLGTITNAVSVTSSTPDPEPANNEASEDTEVIIISDLVITKKAKDEIKPGKKLKFEIKVRNWGPFDAPNVVITDFLPAGVTLMKTKGCAEDPAGVPTCSVGTIRARKKVTVRIYVMVDEDATGVIVNTATVSTDATDPDPSTNTATTETQIKVKKTDDNDDEESAGGGAGGDDPKAGPDRYLPPRDSSSSGGWTRSAPERPQL